MGWRFSLVYLKKEMRQIVVFVKKNRGHWPEVWNVLFPFLQYHFDCSLVIFGAFIKGNMFLESVCASLLMNLSPNKINKSAIFCPKLKRGLPPIAKWFFFTTYLSIHIFSHFKIFESKVAVTLLWRCRSSHTTGLSRPRPTNRKSKLLECQCHLQPGMIMKPILCCRFH